MIKSYTMDVYPRTLFVAIDEPSQNLRDIFHETEEFIPDFEHQTNAYAVRVTTGKKGGVLVRFKGIEQASSEIIAHECFHALMYFCEYLGIVFGRENEHAAYMLEWCIRKTNEAVAEFKNNTSKSNKESDLEGEKCGNCMYFESCKLTQFADHKKVCESDYPCGEFKHK